MQKKLFGFCFTGLIVTTFFLNFNSFLMGHPSKWFNIAASALYAACWYVFIVLSKKDKKRLNFSITCGFFTLVCAVITLIVNINDKIAADFFIPFVIIFLTPLYGTEALFGQSKFLMASIVDIIVSMGWIITASVFLKRIKRT